jgi:hypothetical protein
VDAIGEIDVSDPRWSEDVPVPHGRSLVGVAGGVFGTIRLGFDNDAGGTPFGCLVEKSASEKVYGDLSRIPITESGS